MGKSFAVRPLRTGIAFLTRKGMVLDVGAQAQRNACSSSKDWHGRHGRPTWLGKGRVSSEWFRKEYLPNASAACRLLSSMPGTDAPIVTDQPAKRSDHAQNAGEWAQIGRNPYSNPAKAFTCNVSADRTRDSVSRVLLDLGIFVCRRQYFRLGIHHAQFGF